MLELLRTRAAELLAASADGPDIVRRHARAIADVADEIDLAHWGAYTADWTDLLTALLPEFRRAHDAAIELGEWEVAGRLAASYGSFWHREGGLPEGAARTRAVLDHEAELSAETRGRLLAAAGLVAWDVGDVSEARAFWLAAIEHLESTVLKSSLAYVLAGAAVTTIDEPERHDWARDVLDRAESIARTTPSTVLAEVLNFRGEFSRATGDDESARTAYSDVVRYAAEAGNLAVEAVGFANLGYTECHAGRYDEARRMTRKALRLSIAGGRRLMAAWSVGELAISSHGLGEHELAARLIGAGMRAMETLNAGRYPADVNEDERVIAGLIEHLGEDEYERLVAEGRTLTLDQAISLALGEGVDDD
jgi:tetratricopeptide (TPR) repeat protein